MNHENTLTKYMQVYTHICTHICAVFENASSNYLALFLKHNKQLHFQLHMITETQILCRHPKECYWRERDGEGKRSQNMFLVWERGREGLSGFQCAQSLWLISTQEGNVTLHVGLSNKLLLVPTPTACSWLPIPRLLFTSSHTFQDSSTPCLIVLEEWSAIQGPKDYETSPFRVC